MDAPSNGGRDSRFNLNSYDMPILGGGGESASEIYNSNILHNRPTSITSGLSRSSVSLNNSCASTGLPRGMKRTSAEMCYDQNMQNRSMMNVNDCGSDIMEDSYSPSSHQKNSPLSNGKKTKGRVKIKMEYIDNKLRRYTTFSKRKTGIMKKAYELSTLTGTQVMLLVASETGHVYTFATRKLQPMITSESGKNLIQMCLNSPDPCPSGSGDQRMSATGFEETELSYNVGDDEKVDSSSCSPYRSDSSDSSEVESASGSPPSSPPPLISLQDIQSTSSTPATKIENGIRCIPLNSFLQAKKMATSTSSASGPPSVHFVDVNAMENAADKNATSASTSSVQAATTMTTTATDSASAAGASSADILNKTSSSNGLIFTLEQLQREFGIHMTAGTAMPQYITIPLLTGISNNANPPAAHQTPADLSNRSRK